MHVQDDIKKQRNLSKQDQLWDMRVSIAIKLASASALSWAARR